MWLPWNSFSILVHSFSSFDYSNFSGSATKNSQYNLPDQGFLKFLRAPIRGKFIAFSLKFYTYVNFVFSKSVNIKKRKIWKDLVSTYLKKPTFPTFLHNYRTKQSKKHSMHKVMGISTKITCANSQRKSLPELKVLGVLAF